MAKELKAYGMDDPEVGDEYEMYRVSEVDAVLAEKDAEIRRLKRALWLARAVTAKHLVTTFENYDYLDVYKLNIKQETARMWMSCKLRTPAEWIKVFNKVEVKLLKKAEEYK